ncbi:acylneuraminate cytidylyltransferase family protein [uncultured Desulfosarcina sp.]|uniref:acylneuraminate cytidylyltransferase family protein n=1 Tax=uncultured Desulfosarcina sp. TaxID=218289 RepID=UPI0029C82E76|nr:acylneuraminate cytidylyltransferase family protein [uncultured Desulfosarcina sp.]
MANKPKILAVIPARGGSKGLPRKNILEIAGKPLIAWTIEAAQRSAMIDRLVLSSEDTEIINVARNWGCEVPFIRPQELSLDHTPGVYPVLHALEMLNENYDYVVLLQPTSPLRQAEDIDACIKLCKQTGAPSCVSVVQSDQNPYWMYSINSTHKLHPIIKNKTNYFRRQELPAIYSLNGAIYVAKPIWLNRTKSFITNETIGYVMPKERSVDIDSKIDFDLCSIYLQQIDKPI